jgi:FXSXX-COOH protein
MSEDLAGTTALIDVSDLPLEDLRKLSSAPLRRVLEHMMGDGMESIAGFNSAA